MCNLHVKTTATSVERTRNGKFCNAEWLNLRGDGSKHLCDLGFSCWPAGFHCP